MSEVVENAGAYFLKEEKFPGEALGIVHTFGRGRGLESLRFHMATVNFFPFDKDGSKDTYQVTAIGYSPIKRDLGDVRVEADEMGATYIGHTIPIWHENLGPFMDEIRDTHSRHHVSDYWDDIQRIRERVVPQFVSDDFDTETDIGSKRIEEGITRRLYGVDIPLEWVDRLREVNPGLDHRFVQEGTGIRVSEQGLRLVMAYEQMVNRRLAG